MVPRLLITMTIGSDLLCGSKAAVALRLDEVVAASEGVDLGVGEVTSVLVLPEMIVELTSVRVSASKLHALELLVAVLSVMVEFSMTVRDALKTHAPAGDRQGEGSAALIVELVMVVVCVRRVGEGQTRAADAELRLRWSR